jgi:hypothetical protein
VRGDGGERFAPDHRGFCSYVAVKDNVWGLFNCDSMGGKGKVVKKEYEEIPCDEFEVSTSGLELYLRARDGGRDFKFRVGAGEGEAVAKEWLVAFLANGAMRPGEEAGPASASASSSA